MFVGLPQLEATLVGSLLVVNTSNTPINADALPTYRVYGPDGLVVTGTTSLKDTGSVDNATNATPIVITSSAHGLVTGARVTVASVGGNTAANGTFAVTKVDNGSFSLDTSVGNGSYTSGGTWNVTGLYSYSITVQGVDGFEVGESYQVLFSYDISSTATGQLHSFVVT
jgi:hypothetical protein